MIRTPLVIFHQSYVIELFHSSGQQLCKFIGTDESFYMRRRLKLSGLVWDTNMAAVSLYWDTNVSAVTSCGNALVVFFFLCIFDTVYFPPQCPCQQDRPHDETEIFPTQAENAFVVLKLLF